jgi:hypothetical protein
VRRQRNANANPDGNGNRNCYRYTDRHRYRHSYSYSERHRNSYRDCDSECQCNSNRNTDRHRHSVSDGERQAHGIAYGDTTTRYSSDANTASSADTKASPITAVAVSLCEAQATIVSGVDARLTETRLQLHSI